MYIFNLMDSLNKSFRRLSFLCIVFLSIAVYSQSIPQTSQLVGYYSFSGNVNDSSGNNYNGVTNGSPTLSTDRFGNGYSAYSLDGVGDYIYFGNAMYADFPDTDNDDFYEDSFSISIWAKSSVNAEEALLAFGEDIGLYTGMIARIGGNISFNSSNWGFSTSASGKKHDGLWHQYVFVYRAGSYRRMYIDGSLVSQSNDTLRRFNFKNYGVSVGKERFNASGTETFDNTYTGSVDEVRIWNVDLTGTEISDLYAYENDPANTFLPGTISGTTAICIGESTTLTSSGGSTGSNVIDVWYKGGCGGEAFSQGWDSQPYATTNTTTVNSTTNGILNVTSTSSDPYIGMYGIGSFNPVVNKYLNIRYKVVSGTAGVAQIFFLNSAITVPNGGYYLAVNLISDNNWHVATLDMSAQANWTDSNITGWRFDYATNTGVTLDIDFIQLGSSPIIGTGSSILVTPNVDTTYYVNRKGPNANTACISNLVTVNTLPIPTFTAQPGVLIAINQDVTYSTQTGQTNYVWTLPGVLNTDYSITSGGASGNNTMVLKWLTTGSKTLTVNYTNANNCTATIPTASTISNVQKKTLTSTGLQILGGTQSINRYGQIGTDTSLDKYGNITVAKPGSGLTSASAGLSASAIKQEYSASTNGIYWITNPNINSGTPFQVYADMTTDGGGWMLLNVGAGNTAAPEASTVTSPNTLGYLSRATVIELAKVCTDVQLRAGASSTSYANKTTSTSPLAIGALQSSATDVNGAATWANGASATFVVNSGSWLWQYCCPGSADGWPKMYHSSNYTNGVHWFADLGIGRKNSSPRDAWFSTWIR